MLSTDIPDTDKRWDGLFYHQRNYPNSSAKDCQLSCFGPDVHGFTASMGTSRILIIRILISSCKEQHMYVRFQKKSICFCVCGRLTYQQLHHWAPLATVTCLLERCHWYRYSSLKHIYAHTHTQTLAFDTIGHASILFDSLVFLMVSVNSCDWIASFCELTLFDRRMASILGETSLCGVVLEREGGTDLAETTGKPGKALFL